MKIREFVESNKNIRTNGTISKTVIKINYLPFKEKVELIDKIVNKCIYFEDGLFSIDEFEKYLVFTMEIIQAYTKLEFDADMDIATSEYDMLCEHDLLNSIIGLFEGEYNTVMNMLNVKIADILKHNDIEYQAAKFLNNLNDTLGDLSATLKEKADSFNLSSLGISTSDLSALRDFLKTIRK